LLGLDDLHGLVVLDDGSDPTGKTPSGLGDLGKDFILIVGVLNEGLKYFNKGGGNVVLIVVLALLKELGSEKLLLCRLPIVELSILTGLALNLFTWYVKHQAESLDHKQSTWRR